MKLLRVILACVMFAALPGCRHHDLCFHHMHEITIKVVYDWRFSPQADPKGMRIFFYKEGESRATKLEFNNKYGGQVSLTTGRYRIISYNNDCEYTQFDLHHDFDGHMAYTRQGNHLEPIIDSTAPTKVNGESVVICPDDIFVCSAIDVEITQDGISYNCVTLDDAGEFISNPYSSHEQIITLFPQDILCHYSYEVLNVDGLERISQLCGSLSGMCPSVKMSSLDKHTLPVTLPFESRITDDGRIVGEFLTFGHNTSLVKPHNMEFYVWTHSGNRYIIGRGEPAHDLTEQVHSAPNPRRVHLIIDHIKIPQESGNTQSAAMSTTDDWFEIDTPIDL